MNNLFKMITDELSQIVLKLDTNEFEELSKEIISHKKVFVAGAGRSGSIMDTFAKRLMHADIDVYIVGDVITPPIKEGDLLIIASGSGETESLVVNAKKAKSIGAEVALITTSPSSSVGNIADYINHIPTTSPKAENNKEKASNQPMANLYEQTLFIYCDALVMNIAKIKGLSEEEMFARHANIE